MKTTTKMLMGAAAALSFAGSANAALLVPGAENQAFTAFDITTQGTQLAFVDSPANARTFSSIFRQAVYRNTLGTLDFYYQVQRTGPGQFGNNEIEEFTVGSFAGFTVDAQQFAGDPDGSGGFLAGNNPTPAGGSSTRVSRDTDEVIEVNFTAAPNSQGNLNGLVGTENSVTYIFRTNATVFNQLGSFGVINSSAADGASFQPAIPEPATWGMMLMGFGLIGAGLRSRTRKVRVNFA